MWISMLSFPWSDGFRRLWLHRWKGRKLRGQSAFDGNVAPGAFKYTINLGASQSSALTNELTLVPRVEVNRYGPIWWDVANTPRYPARSADTAECAADPQEHEEMGAGSLRRNLTNRQYYQEVVPLLGGFSVNFRGATRTYEWRPRYSF